MTSFRPPLSVLFLRSSIMFNHPCILLLPPSAPHQVVNPILPMDGFGLQEFCLLGQRKVTMKGKGFGVKSNTPLVLEDNSVHCPWFILPSPHTREPRLTEGLHQISLHVVGHQGLRQLWEEGLHGSCYCVDGEVLLHQVQIVVWKKREKN